LHHRISNESIFQTMNAPARIKRLKTALPMPSSDLAIGMFVAELDCGWQGSPFLLEGVMITSPAELATIRRLALQVVVDPTRSRVDVFSGPYSDAIHETEAVPVVRAAAVRRPVDYASVQRVKEVAAEIETHGDWRQGQDAAGREGLLQRIAGILRSLFDRAGAGQSKPATDALPAADPQKFAGLLKSVYSAPAKSGLSVAQRLSAWLHGLRKSGPAVIPVARPAYVPQQYELVAYPEPEATSAAMPKALEACEMSARTLTEIITRIADNAPIDLHALQTAADTLAENMISRPATMMLAARMRDENDRIYQHGLGVAIYLTMLGRHLGFQREPLAELATVGMLLDLGKMALDQSMLDKPGKFDAVESKLMQEHVAIGVERLAAAGVTSALVLRAIGEHHERVDGLGYPNGCAGDDISIYGKMAAIADSFVAMIGDRPYAPTMSTFEALRALFAEAGSRWHAPLVEQLVQAIGVFPVGSLIELSTGEVAIVTQDNRFRRLEPKVLILTDRDKQPVQDLMSLDLMKHNFAIAPKSVRIARGLPDGAFGVNFREYYLNRHR
jgi:HD-GYP domain-containing protein (c-di-GMP phosphodiesterase class II)